MATAQERDSGDFLDTLRVDLFDDEVFVFTPAGEVKALPSGATPLDFAYSVHTDVGHRCVGAKVNGRIVPLHYRLQSGEIVEILTSKAERGPSRDWMGIVTTSRARNKIRHWFAREQREDLEQKGRDSLVQAFRSHGLPHQKLSSSPLLAQLIREMGFKKAEDFYVAIGAGKVPVGQIANKVLQRLKTAGVVEDEDETSVVRRRTRGPAHTSRQYGVVVDGKDDPDVLVRMAKCCTPVPGDEITGYISVGRGVTVHRTDCPERPRAAAHPGALLRRRVVGRRLAVVQGRDRGRGLGSPAPARGHRPHVRRVRLEHRRVRRRGAGRDGPQLVRRRARRRQGARAAALGAPERRGDLRRESRHAARRQRSLRVIHAGTSSCR